MRDRESGMIVILISCRIVLVEEFIFFFFVVCGILGCFVRRKSRIVDLLYVKWLLVVNNFFVIGL